MFHGLPKNNGDNNILTFSVTTQNNESRSFKIPVTATLENEKYMTATYVYNVGTIYTPQTISKMHIDLNLSASDWMTIGTAKAATYEIPYDGTHFQKPFKKEQLDGIVKVLSMN